MNIDIISTESTPDFFKDAQNIIEHSRKFAYKAVNVAMVLRNWLLGRRIAEEELKNGGRAEYGKEVIQKLSDHLTNIYGKGFDRISLYNYLRFYKMFPRIVDAVGQQSDHWFDFVFRNERRHGTLFGLAGKRTFVPSQVPDLSANC